MRIVCPSSAIKPEQISSEELTLFPALPDGASLEPREQLEEYAEGRAEKNWDKTERRDLFKKPNPERLTS